MRTSRSLVVAALVVLAVAGACSDDGGSSSGSGSSGTSSATAAPLVGTNWVLTGPSSIGNLDQVTVSAVFTSSTMSGTSGCNRYNAPIARDGQKLEVNGPIASTQIACDPPASNVETAYLAALPDVKLFAISGTTLSLQNLQGKTILTYRASGKDDLVGEWVVTSLYTGNAISSPATGTTLTAAFTKDTISGSGGCNNYNGPAKATNAGAIAIGPLATTLKLCDAAVSTQEQQYLAALALAKTYEVEGDTLTLFRDGGTIAATFTRG